ncbi:hypothetical protein M409DRAFT_67051 [Zasmidium cellare ATCC 36951]|uniref:Peptidase M14 domain-containing protein n=1 Tax=Zasmidium cellare ATCC 36951 TaxID=1080233 RepID=A0A6A6CHJ3_ZASCE|nr:uncharacterized protein M409DRAFT_67051 [Zasmidium cellare ATCC 36951]KAF2165668.1 hypothetical protein M409DRAFT_67051 [Zasmidium cellare ATCC 36951]
MFPIAQAALLFLSGDSDVVSQAFQDVEGIELLSPAFTTPDSLPPGWANGTSGPTSDAVLQSFYQSIAARNDWLTYQPGEFLSEEGRAIPYLFLAESAGSAARNDTKLQVYIQAAIHGDEPAGDQAVAALIGKMDRNQTWTASLLERISIKILPRYNPDGVAYFQHQLASSLDGNRDHIKLDRQQSRDIKQTFMDYIPHISVDMHEFVGPTVYAGDYHIAADAMISGGVNPNIHPDIRALLLDNFIPHMGDKLAVFGLRWEPYVIGASDGSRIVLAEAETPARTGRNAYGLTQTVSFLCEMRGIMLAEQHFQRRVSTGLLQLEAILETARNDFANVYTTIERARREFINSTEDIVVTDSPTLQNRTFTMIDRNNGSVLQVPVDFYGTTPSVANLTRPRPEAYLLPRTYSSLASLLRTQGLEISTLDHAFHGPVEALRITSSSLSDTLYEGHVRHTVTTSQREREVHLPAGSFLVSTRQQNAALAFVALEPENVDSFVAFNLIPVGVGDEYPVYRVLA